MINIMIADDHVMFRRGIKSILETTGSLRIVEEAGDSEELLEKLSKKSHLHVLLLDVSLPGRSGIDLASQVRTIRPEIMIVILTMHEEEQCVVRALKAGCSGYILKSSTPEELIEGIKRVSMGEKHISPKVAKELAEFISRDTDRKLHETLSNREYDILCSIARGKSFSEISSSLSLSLKTVSTYKMRICKKLSCKNIAEITRYAIQNKIV